MCVLFVFFFFSSRRRHTRSKRDWSSDVCSSDLGGDAPPVPVIAAGGIVDGRGIAAALALGAQGVWLGTRFLLAEEAPLHEEYRERLLAASGEDAVYAAELFDVGWEHAPHRALRNSTRERWE